MTDSHQSHSRNTSASDYVDSSATTFVGSPQAKRLPSLDEEPDYARISLSSDAFRKEPTDHDAGSDSGSDGHPNEHESLVTKTLEPLVRHASAIEAINSHGDDPPPPPIEEAKKDKAVSWSQLPRKGQLAILALARLSEPLAATSLQSYVFYQLKSFKQPDGSNPSDDTVAKQAGILAAAFAAAQFVTAILWGRIADWERVGRKRVLLIGLVGVAIGSLGFGFSQSFPEAVFWRCVGGFLNGNIGVMRTMVSEIIKEKRFQSRAFLLLPMTFNVGIVIGPLIGGLLADPVGSFPSIFGPGSALGGKDGVYWLTKWPYALPNVVNAIILLIGALALMLGLQETHEALVDRPDWGLRFSRWVGRAILRIKPKQRYVAIGEQEEISDDIESRTLLKHDQGGRKQRQKARVRRKLPLRRIWTPNVIFELISYGLMIMHVGTFNNLWFVFLSTSRYDPDYHPNTTSEKRAQTLAEHSTPIDVPANYRPQLPFRFTGGLALPPPAIGTALAILGVIGLTLQLLLYPRLSFKLGTVRSLRYSLLLFPIAYILIPYLSVLPSTRPPPGQASGFLVWAGITLVLCVQVMGRTFALPSNAILLNNCSPHPSVLGTIHGIGQSVSAAARTVGPALAGWIYSAGLQKGVVGLAWWFMAGVAVVGALAGRLVWEGDGHEIWLEGEREELEGEGS